MDVINKHASDAKTQTKQDNNDDDDLMDPDNEDDDDDDDDDKEDDDKYLGENDMQAQKRRGSQLLDDAVEDEQSDGSDLVEKLEKRLAGVEDVVEEDVEEGDLDDLE
jgi:hypothetical protein